MSLRGVFFRKHWGGDLKNKNLIQFYIKFNNLKVIVKYF